MPLLGRGKRFKKERRFFIWIKISWWNGGELVNFLQYEVNSNSLKSHTVFWEIWLFYVRKFVDPKRCNTMRKRNKGKKSCTKQILLQMTFFLMKKKQTNQFRRKEIKCDRNFKYVFIQTADHCSISMRYILYIYIPVLYIKPIWKVKFSIIIEIPT